MEIEQLITDWWTTAYDPSAGDADGGYEYLTGIMITRGRQFDEDLAEQGLTLVSRGLSVIEITSIEVDIDKGQGVVNSCTGSDVARADIETMEPVDDGDDPDYQFTSEWYVALTDDGWKISEWYPSYNNTPIECEIGATS